MSSRVSIVSDGEPLLRFPSVRADRNELTHSRQLERDEPYALPGRGRCRLSVSRLTSLPTCRTSDDASHSHTRRDRMAGRPLPTEQEVRSWIRERRNWGRWGKDDQRGAMNLVTPAKRVAAARLVKNGRSVSLSRPFPKEPGINNSRPAQHYMQVIPRGKGAFAGDYYGIFYHGVASTHIDALCHTWDDEAMWNGRDPKKEITFEGARFGSIEHWQEGIIVRGVMLDVPRHRGVPCVTHDAPVHGWELDDILSKRGIKLEPGDAVCVFSGRDAWQAANPETPYGRPYGGLNVRPGLHVSCLPFLRDHDV